MVNVYRNEKEIAPVWQVVVGYLGAFLFPLVGIIAGIICCCKGRVGNGVTILVLSVLSVLGYVIMNL